MSTAIFVATTARNQYVPRGRNELHTIFPRHFGDFCTRYDEKYAATYGRYRLERIQQLGERFATCGDYLQGVARIRCTNRECGLVSGYRRLLAQVSRLIYDILREFDHEAPADQQAARPRPTRVDEAPAGAS